jgi:HK97 family phage major capsid protein
MRFETNEVLLEQVARARLERQDRRRPVTRSQIQQVVRDILARADRRAESPGESFSFGRAIRGLCAMRHQPVVMETAQEDGEYAARALSTGAQPGQYLVPVFQADGIISQLGQLATARAAGCTIWPMKGIQDLNVPAAIGGAPSFVWIAQNSRQTPSDPNATQIAFDLKLCQALILMPVQLFRDAVPQWDTILEESLAVGMAEAEDQAFHASSTLSVDAPKALMSQAGITTLNAAGNSASGGNLLYADLLATLQKSVDLKVRSPLSWFMAGRTLLRILSLQDTQSRPLLIPTYSAPAENIGPAAGYSLLGWPVYLSSSISTTEAVGSGSNQSHAILTNAKNCIHIAESGDVALAASTDFALDSGDVAVRVSHRVSFGYQPAAGIVVLAGIN